MDGTQKLSSKSDSVYQFEATTPSQDGQNEPPSPKNNKKRRRRNKNKNTTSLELLEKEALDVIEKEEDGKKNANNIKHHKFDDPVVPPKSEVEPEEKNAELTDHTNISTPGTKHIESQRKHPRKPTKPKTVEFFSDDEEDNFKRHTVSTSDLDLAQRATDLLTTRETLPVYKAKDDLIKRLRKNKVTILIGETGSGKSTQIPQFLLPINRGGVAVTQPRRVAAINLATRVAEEYGSVLGDKVGYSVRFDNRAHNGTKLKYLTDGMLLREIMMNSDLSQYTTVIIDEAHERTVLTDLLMGFLKELIAKRDDLKVIIMSATLDAEKFSKFFNNADILFVEGKMYNVERLYLDNAVDDIVDATIKAIIQVNNGELAGDVLVFLPGQEEIDKSVTLLEKVAPHLPREAPLIVPLPLYASLPPSEQAKVFLPLKPRRRKIILSTNIAETSVTVPGVKYVIDSGLRKVKVWRHALGLSTLLTAPVSKASATQRAGRAGRESEGKAFRLFTESDYSKLPTQTEPEIARSNVTSPVLMLKRAGVEDILNWSWLENPGQDSLVSALTTLYQLKALDDSGKITELGEQMAILPLEPQLSAILLRAHKSGCLPPVIDIVSCLSVDNLVLNPQVEQRDEINERRAVICQLGNKYGDLIMCKELLDVYLEFGSSRERQEWCKELALSYRGFKNVLKVRNQIRQYMISLTKDKYLFDDDENDGFDSDGETRGVKSALDIPSILKSFLSGFVSNTAIGMPDRSYRTTTSGQLISIHPSSLIFGKRVDAVMYTDYVYTTKGYARNVSVIELEWLMEIGAHVLAPKTHID
jgi:ATP-dependent RNA helicase DHR2